MGDIHKKKKWLIFAVILISIACVTAGIASFFVNKPNAVKRVACVGDSLTEGSNYPEYLWMLLGAQYRVGNFGVNGSTVSLHLGKPYMNQSAFTEAKDFEPSTVVIMLGTNDANPYNQETTASFEEDYIALVREFQKLPNSPQIWLVKPPPVFDNGTGISSEFFAKNIIPAIQAVADKLNLQVIDLYEPLSAHPEYFRFDGVHPTEEGSQAIAQIVHDALV